MSEGISFAESWQIRYFLQEDKPEPEALAPLSLILCVLCCLSWAVGQAFCVNLTVHSLGPGQHLYKVLIGSVFGCLYITNSS